MYIDPALNDVDNVLALINFANDTTLTALNVTISLPTELTATPEDSYNAQVTVTAIPDKGYINSTVMKYNRVNVMGNLFEPLRNFPVVTGTPIDQVTAALEVALELPPGHIVLEGFTQLAPAIFIVAKHNSLLVVGSATSLLTWQ